MTMTMTMDSDSDCGAEYSEGTTDFSEETEDCTYCLHQANLQDTIPAKCTIASGQPCQACQRLWELRDKIEATKQLLDQLVLEERKARVDVNSFHDPIHRLPPETTSHIFRFTLPDFALQEKRTVDWDLPSETWVLTLGAVCQRWRNIAWSTPDLWSTMMLTFRDEPTLDNIMVVNEWLERSKKLPLSIRFFLLDESWWMENRENMINPKIRALGSLLKEHSNRWKNLSLECNQLLLKDFIKNVNGTPLLDTLQLIIWYPFRGDRLPEFEFGEKGVDPQPNHVIMLGFRHLQDIGVSWNDVTEATVDKLVEEDCIQLLLTCPKLVKVRLQDIGENIDRSDDISNISIPQAPRILHRLRSLYISSSTSFAAFLDIITLPSLEELSINGPGPGVWDCNRLDSTLTGKIVKLLERSSCQLTSFSFEKVKCYEQEVIDIIYSLPSSVNDLQLDVQSPNGYSRIDNLLALFDHLARAPTATNGTSPRSELLPNLETFKHQVYKDGPIPWGRLPNLLRPMSGKPRPFKKLTIVERDRFDDVKPLIFTGKEIGRSAVLDLVKLMADGVDLFLPHKISSQDLLALLEEQSIV